MSMRPSNGRPPIRTAASALKASRFLAPSTLPYLKFLTTLSTRVWLIRFWAKLMIPWMILIATKSNKNGYIDNITAATLKNLSVDPSSS